MLHEKFNQQNVANSIENERFELKNVANTVETAASSSKMLEIPPKCCKFCGKWEVPTPKCCKDSWNSSFQLQNAANSQENGQTTDLKTRWSPRTRMLTRMLMVQMSKHMVLQSRTIPFCNSLFEQSCTCFPCYQSAVWSGKCRVWSVECEVRSVECKVWSGECRVCKV